MRATTVDPFRFYNSPPDSGYSIDSYSRESVIAEKFQIMVRLDALNSRMKDHYDIWMLSRQFAFDGQSLTEAVRQTFARRHTDMPAELQLFRDPVTPARQAQWVAFRTRLPRETVPTAFEDIAVELNGFLAPVAAAVAAGSPFSQVWTGRWA